MGVRPGQWDFDPDGDFLVADGMESQVGLSPLLSDGTYGPTYYGRGCRETPRRNAAGLVEAADLVWHLNAADYPVDRINRGDRIIDGCGVAWIVSTAELAGVQDQWRCDTIRSTETT